MKKLIAGVLLLIAGTGMRAADASADPIRIVATTKTFESIARHIAGDKAEYYSIAPPSRNLHFISPTPKDVLKVKKADVFIHGGLDLEVWRDPLLNAAGRPDLMTPAGTRQIDVSKGIRLLEIPQSLSRALGDIHAYGNPHYWTDPENGKIIAANIAEGLARIYPEHAGYFKENAGHLIGGIDAKMTEWQSALAPFKGQPVVTYHRSWTYFLERFGLRDAGQLEPRPGIPPTARHLAELEHGMRRDGVRVILKETYFENRTPKKISGETGAAVIDMALSVGEIKEASGYVEMMDYNVRQLARALASEQKV